MINNFSLLFRWWKNMCQKHYVWKKNVDSLVDRFNRTITAPLSITDVLELALMVVRRHGITILTLHGGNSFRSRALHCDTDQQGSLTVTPFQSICTTLLSIAIVLVHFRCSNGIKSWWMRNIYLMINTFLCIKIYLIINIHDKSKDKYIPEKNYLNNVCY